METIRRRTLQKIKASSLFWTCDVDVSNESIYVYFADGEPTESRESADGNYRADIAYDDAFRPVVLGIEMTDPIRVGVIIDWIHEATELSLAEFGDEFVKGTMQVCADEEGKTTVRSLTEIME